MGLLAAGCGPSTEEAVAEVWSVTETICDDLRENQERFLTMLFADDSLGSTYSDGSIERGRSRIMLVVRLSRFMDEQVGEHTANVASDEGVNIARALEAMCRPEWEAAVAAVSN